MKKYPNASSKTEVEILKIIDDDSIDYNKDAYREMLGKIMVPDESYEIKVRVGKIREAFTKGNTTHDTYLISLENNSSSTHPEFNQHLNSLRNLVKDENEYNIAKYAEDDVRMMRKTPDKEIANEDIAIAISHHLLRSKEKENISYKERTCFDDTHKNLYGIYRNASTFLEPEKRNYIREAFANNPEKAMEFSNTPNTVAPKDDREHPMMPKIWKALEIGRNYQSKVVNSDVFNRFTDKAKKNQIERLANISNSSLLIFGKNEDVAKDLLQAQAAYKKVSNPKGQSFTI